MITPLKKFVKKIFTNSNRASRKTLHFSIKNDTIKDIISFAIRIIQNLKMAVFWVMIALMMEAVQTSETSVNLYQSTRLYNPEYDHLHGHRRENVKSYIQILST
jgi:hypothetical protein